jgi:DNA-binding MarR family transcriptional regulator
MKPGGMQPGARPPRLVYLVNRAQKAIARWIECRPDAWEGASGAQAGLLFVLAARNEAAVGEIAQALDVAPAAVTNLSKRMQAAGLVERVGDAFDARLTRLRLTAAGRQASDRAHAVLAELNAQLTAGFSQDELQVVARWLEHSARITGQGQGPDA